MVLEEASSDQASSFEAGSSDQSFQDRTSSPSSAYPQARPFNPYIRYNTLPPSIRLSDLPRANPIPGASRAFGPELLTATIVREASNVAAVLGRPLETPEWESVAYWAAKENRTKSYGVDFGLITSGIYAIATDPFRGTTPEKHPQGIRPFKMPFVKSSPPGQGWPDLTKFLSLRGPAAGYAWRAARTTSYMTLGAVVWHLLIASYAATVSAVGRGNDPRMADFSRVIKKAGIKEANKFFDELRRVNEQGRPQPISASGEQEEGMGKTGWNADGESVDEGPQVLPGENGVSAWQRMQRTGQGDMEAAARAQQRAGQPRRQRQAAVDDASPTGGIDQEPLTLLTDEMVESRKAEASKQQQQQQQQLQYGRSGPVQDGQSAWARLRRGNPPNTQSQRPQYEDSASNERSAWDVRRQAAMNGSQSPDQEQSQDQAQRDFDARLDRERRGQNFDDTSTSGGRWKP